jgi:hypothetical protein
MSCLLSLDHLRGHPRPPGPLLAAEIELIDRSHVAVDSVLIAGSSPQMEPFMYMKAHYYSGWSRSYPDKSDSIIAR